MIFLKNVKSFISLWMLIGWASFLILILHNHGSNGSFLHKPQIPRVVPTQNLFNHLSVDRSDSLNLAQDHFGHGSYFTDQQFEDNRITQNRNEYGSSYSNLNQNKNSNLNSHPYENKDTNSNSNKNVMDVHAISNIIGAIFSPDSESESESGVPQRDEDEYPSFQDYLERIADVGYGYLLRDLLSGYLAEDASARLIIGNLGKIGVVAYAAQLIAETGNSTGLIPEDESRKILRFSRYTGFGIALIGSLYDMYILVDGTRCLVRQKRVRKLCLLEDEDDEDSDSEYFTVKTINTNTNINSSHSHIHSIIRIIDTPISISKQLKRIDQEAEQNKEKTKEKAKAHLKWKTIFDHGNEADARFCEEMRKRAQLREASGESPSICNTDYPYVEILASLLATSSDVVGFVAPQYGQAGGLTEALYQVLAYLYIQADRGGHFNNVEGHPVLDLGELGELIYRELKGIFEDSGPPFPGLPDWMFKELFKHR